MNSYQAIDDYGLIGDMHSAALVSAQGSIDWFCFPYFDSPSVFAALVDSKKGGFFRISPVGTQTRSIQLYWPDTNLLITRFFTPSGVGEVIDFMPVRSSVKSETTPAEMRQIVRRVRCVRGNMTFQMVCSPAFNYARDPHELEITPQGALFRSASGTILLSGEVGLRQEGLTCHSEFHLAEDESASLYLGAHPSPDELISAPSDGEGRALFHETVAYWRAWIAKCTYKGRWREAVHRSAFALKLLTFEPTGAIIAAPTTSLPESLGGTRNWDYRYVWIRDAAFTVYAFLKLGFREEAASFIKWVEQRCSELAPDGSLQVMYSIHGGHNLEESELTHLDGYFGSRPVRIGNGAFDQLQLDIAGDLIDAVYLFDKYASQVSYEFWTHLCRLVEWVCDRWKEKDESIWEVRGGRKHFVYSKVMCWVAIDRAIRLARKRSYPAPRERWESVRDEIFLEVMEKGWNQEREAFQQSYEDKCLDASVLMIPLTFFLSPGDPRVLSTISAIRKSLANGGLVANSLVYRYNLEDCQDGVEGEEGTFNICTFWLIEAMTRASKADPTLLEDARLIFEKMLGFSNHLGLFSEQIGMHGEALGNYPQAFTHLGLISTAYNLDRALDGDA